MYFRRAKEQTRRFGFDGANFGPRHAVPRRHVLHAAAFGERNEATLVLPILSSIAQSVVGGGASCLPSTTSSCCPSTMEATTMSFFPLQLCPDGEIQEIVWAFSHNANFLANPLSEAHCRHDESSFRDAPAPRARPNATESDWHPVPNSEQQCQNANVQTHQRSLVRVFSAWFLLRDQKTHTKSTTVSYLSISLSCFLSGPIPVLLHPSPPSQALHSLPPSSVHPRASQMPQYFTCHQAIQWG